MTYEWKIIGIYYIGKMNSQKWKLDFTILYTNLAIGPTDFTMIMNQVHYINKPI